MRWLAVSAVRLMTTAPTPDAGTPATPPISTSTVAPAVSADVARVSSRRVGVTGVNASAVGTQPCTSTIRCTEPSALRRSTLPSAPTGTITRLLRTWNGSGLRFDVPGTLSPCG